MVILKLVPQSLSRLVHSLFDQEHIIKREKAHGTRLRHWILSLPTDPPPTVARKNSQKQRVAVWKYCPDTS